MSKSNKEILTSMPPKSAAPNPRKPRKPPSSVNKDAAQPLKVVIRKLPQELPENVFWKTVEKWVGETKEKASWTWYSKGKFRKMRNKHDIYSRAYITFKTYEDLSAFHQAFDGWLFRDKQGTVYPALVEFAPFQKTPVPTRKTDPRQGTIEEDSEFKSFLDRLANPTTETEPPAASPPLEISKTTPLLEHIKALREAEKEAKTTRSHRSNTVDPKNILLAPKGQGSGGRASGRGHSGSLSNNVAQGGAGGAASAGTGSGGGKEERDRKKRGGKGKKGSSGPPTASSKGKTSSTSNISSVSGQQQTTPTIARRPHPDPPTRQQSSNVSSLPAPASAATTSKEEKDTTKGPGNERRTRQLKSTDVAGQRRALGAALSAIAGGGRERRGRANTGGGSANTSNASNVATNDDTSKG